MTLRTAGLAREQTEVDGERVHSGRKCERHPKCAGV